MLTLPLKRKKGFQSQDVIDLYEHSLQSFADDLIKMQSEIDMKMTARGWCYALENKRVINKDQFDWMQDQIQDLREQGYLKPGFIQEDDGHEVSKIYDYDVLPEDYVLEKKEELESAQQTFETCYRGYDYASFWDNQKAFIQLVVEKSDLKNLFKPICEKYKIPLANMKGWGSLEQKAVIAKKFKEYEEKGLKPVLFACTDFDPPGLYISKILKETFKRLEKFTDWNPENLEVIRIGLNYDFIKKNKLTWIDNLLSGSKKDMADENHVFYKNNVYDLKNYIVKYGKKKCEGNALVVATEKGRKLLIKNIEEVLGKGVFEKYEVEIEKRKDVIYSLINE